MLGILLCGIVPVSAHFRPFFFVEKKQAVAEHFIPLDDFHLDNGIWSQQPRNPPPSCVFFWTDLGLCTDRIDSFLKKKENCFKIPFNWRKNLNNFLKISQKYPKIKMIF